MRRTLVGTAAVLTTLLAVPAPVAWADHTDPREPQAPVDGTTSQADTRGDGTWRHIANFPGYASPALTGGGTDLEFFRPGRSSDIWGAFGTLGQDEAGSVGQRFIRLTKDGKVAPRWVADHGSAHCATDNTSVTGLQHDTQIAKRNGVTLLTDTTDALGRCHDPDGGGIEIVDVTKIQKAKFKPREVHLVRFAGYTHTNTVDKKRPWIVYNSSSDFANRNWIDVMDMRSCFGDPSWSLKKRRAECRPKVSRIQMKDAWTQQKEGDQLEPGSAACHDITYKRGRLYCAALNSTVILDVRNIVNDKGQVRGESFPCKVVAGTRTRAKVTDCSGMEGDRKERARGWKLAGLVNHPGRDCEPSGDNRTCNSNLEVRSDEGVAVSHEADPTHDGKFMFVTDERGGGIVPPGASCGPSIDNPYGNGGMHAFDIRNPDDIKYARTPGGDKAVFIGDAVVAAPTFCGIHVIEHIPGEQRLIAAYYSQGIKIIDYYVDDRGRMQFVERASFTLPNANTWSAEPFKIRKNKDGTKTYFIAADDIHRGIDVLSWRAKPNPVGAKAPESNDVMRSSSLLGGSLLVVAAAAAVRRRRRQSV